MFNLLAQASSYDFNYDTNTAGNSAATGGLMAFLGAYFLILAAVFVFYAICNWKIFEKAGVEGWKALIPGYNMWILAEIAGKPGWWGIVGLGGIIPIIGIVASIAGFVLYILIAIELAKSFGKESWFAVLLIVVPIVALAMLAFGDAKYVGPGGHAKGSKPAAPAAA